MFSEEFKQKVTSKKAIAFYKRKSQAYSGVSYEMLAAIYAKQEGRCALCDDELVFDTKETHLDHIVPRAKGGNNDSDNIELVCAACNYAKRDSSLQEFVLMCLKVENKYHKTDILPKGVIQNIVERRWQNERRKA